MTLAWTVFAWPPVLWQANQAPHKQLASRFVHLGTQVSAPRRAHEPCTGQTIWGSYLGNGEAGMAWDWIEVSDGVVAMADPMGIITNLQLVDDLGAKLPTLQTALHINEIVHELPWQAEVQMALSQPVD